MRSYSDHVNKKQRTPKREVNPQKKKREAGDGDWDNIDSSSNSYETVTATAVLFKAVPIDLFDELNGRKAPKKRVKCDR